MATLILMKHLSDKGNDMKKGYIEDDHGYSGSFSWWRCANPAFWTVIAYGQFTRSGIAVCDDYGTLVEVK